jgi:hypothetical protein
LSYWEVPVMVQRLCGICPVSHHLAASKAMDMMLGVTLTPTAEKIRRLMHHGQILQSHALHFFHLSSPDLLFGFGSDPAKRNIVGVAAADPETAKKGVLLRKYGQEVIRLTAGKRVHGTGAVPGGVNKSLSIDERDLLLKDAYQMVAWSREAVHLIRSLFEQNLAEYNAFGRFPAQGMGLVGPDGAMDLYHGGLRARDAAGKLLFDHFLQKPRRIRKLFLHDGEFPVVRVRDPFKESRDTTSKPFFGRGILLHSPIWRIGFQRFTKSVSPGFPVKGFFVSKMIIDGCHVGLGLLADFGDGRFVITPLRKNIRCGPEQPYPCPESVLPFPFHRFLDGAFVVLIQIYI